MLVRAQLVPQARHSCHRVNIDELVYMLNTGNSFAPPPVDSSGADPAVTCLDARLVHGIRLNKVKSFFFFI